MPDLIRYEWGGKGVAGFKASPMYSDELLINPYQNVMLYSGSWVNIGEPVLQPGLRYSYCSTSAADKEACKTIAASWPEKENPFTQKVLIDSQEEQLNDIILQFRTYLSNRENLINRLVALIDYAKEEDPTSPGIAVGSLQNFYNFLCLHPNLRCPQISLTPEYDVYASWRGDRNQLFSVHFMPGNGVRFVIFKPNDRHPEQKIRISGIATFDVLKRTVEPHGVWDWISDDVLVEAVA